MSYPRHLRTLIVEDDFKNKELYEEIFLDLARNGEKIGTPVYAFSREDAVRELDDDGIIHLAILDLQIPGSRGQPPEDDIAEGIRVLERCRRRDRYPIPAVLVISGHVDKTQQSSLSDNLSDWFAYGRLIQKGGDPQPEIMRAIAVARSYSDVGIHLQEPRVSVPGLSPRDEDLLRRAALQRNGDGFDLRWWSAEYSNPSTGHSEFRGWTKVLVGNMLLGERGKSDRVFCKLMPAGEFPTIRRDAETLALKLRHAKTIVSVAGGQGALLVTESVCQSPESLDDILNREMRPQCFEGIARAIDGQLRDLGRRGSDRVALCKLLWPHHNMDGIRAIADRHRRREDPPPPLRALCADALEVLAGLAVDESEIAVSVSECLHGDLNATNVAIEIRDPALGDVGAYIFDASNMRRGPALSDLATLEVTLQLHLQSEVTEQQVSVVAEAASVLYGGAFVPPPWEAKSTRGRNTVALVRAMRNNVDEGDRVAYAVAVFDAALVQLGGLAWASRNKVRSFGDCVLLADLAAGWVSRMRIPPNNG